MASPSAQASSRYQLAGRPPAPGDLPDPGRLAGRVQDRLLWPQGPHQVAQKSTSTGLSLSRTWAWKVSSLTVMGLLVTGGRQCAGWKRDGCEVVSAGGGWELWARGLIRRDATAAVQPPGARGEVGSSASDRYRLICAVVGGLVSVDQGGEVAFGVDGGLAAGGGGGDGLAVGVVDHVAGAEHAVEVGAGGGGVDLEVALGVETASTPWQAGSSSSLLRYFLPGKMGQASPQPMVIT